MNLRTARLVLHVDFLDIGQSTTRERDETEASGGDRKGRVGHACGYGPKLGSKDGIADEAHSDYDMDARPHVSHSSSCFGTTILWLVLIL